MTHPQNTRTGRQREPLLPHCRRSECPPRWAQRSPVLCSMYACVCKGTDAPALCEATADLLRAGLRARGLLARTYPTFSAFCYFLCNSRQTSWFYVYILSAFYLLGFKVLFSDFQVFSTFYINFYLPQIHLFLVQVPLSMLKIGWCFTRMVKSPLTETRMSVLCCRLISNISTKVSFL